MGGNDGYETGDGTVGKAMTVLDQVAVFWAARAVLRSAADIRLSQADPLPVHPIADQSEHAGL